ncbi:hypothetical protein CK203_034751 [Vitis vinifera]|uniref:Uncharacterized protein n=1 Tax=Vitis vinifera TaxID=29760 RepID=A0A438HWG1_VITVI|nr:hypothetical protein CK203_034751 [Vitis vinifera]
MWWSERDGLKLLEIQRGLSALGYITIISSDSMLTERVIKELEPKQKAAIEEIGFGSLLQLRCRKIDHGEISTAIYSTFSSDYCLGDDEVLDMKRRLKKLGGYANDNVKIWVIQNEIRDCVDGNAMTMGERMRRMRNLKSIQTKMLLNELMVGA